MMLEPLSQDTRTTWTSPDGVLVEIVTSRFPQNVVIHDVYVSNDIEVFEPIGTFDDLKDAERAAALTQTVLRAVSLLRERIAQ